MHISSYGIAPQPKQMKALLKRHPRFSKKNDKPEFVSSKRSTYNLINDIHKKFKHNFHYVSDRSKDIWQPSKTGDCEDFVFAMIDELEKVGIPKGAMLAVTCKVKGLGGHMVLAIQNDWTTLISDVRFASVLRWDTYSFDRYSWRRIQCTGKETWQWCFKFPTLADLIK